ncbi:MAG TPA: squalene/phytoene synthase family protein [Thermomonospora sp.]|nr:squalene/phytoene synthase family protein [Thermomonospora sp.]
MGRRALPGLPSPPWRLPGPGLPGLGLPDLGLPGLGLPAVVPQVVPWRWVMDAADLREDGLRADYTAAARLAAGRYPGLYPLMRVGLPASWQPYLFAVIAFGVEADRLVDVPARRRDPRRLRAWSEQVRRGLRTGRADRPHLRAFLHTVALRSLDHDDVHLFLEGQHEQQWVGGYDAEQDHHDHVDRVGVPIFRMLFCAASTDARARRGRWLRPVTDGVQRADDLADLSADLRRGRLTIPRTDLDRFGVSRADLESGRDTPAVRALLRHACGKARDTVRTARRELDTAGGDARLLYAPLLLGCRLTVEAAERQGAALARRGVIWQPPPSPFGVLRFVKRRLLPSEA